MVEVVAGKDMKENNMKLNKWCWWSKVGEWRVRISGVGGVIWRSGGEIIKVLLE